MKEDLIGEEVHEPKEQVKGVADEMALAITHVIHTEMKIVGLRVQAPVTITTESRIFVITTLNQALTTAMNVMATFITNVLLITVVDCL